MCATNVIGGSKVKILGFLIPIENRNYKNNLDQLVDLKIIYKNYATTKKSDSYTFLRTRSCMGYAV